MTISAKKTAANGPAMGEVMLHTLGRSRDDREGTDWRGRDLPLSTMSTATIERLLLDVSEESARRIPESHPALDDGISYPGSKNVTGLAEWICDRLPTHVYYAEPFAGKGAIYRHKIPALRTWLIDSDPLTVDWWVRRSRYHLAEFGDARGPRRNRRGSLVAECGNGIRWIELAADFGLADLLVYADPPYLLSTRSKKRIFRNELTHQDHVRLLRAMNRLIGPAAISGYPSELYERELQGWTCHTREVITRGAVKRTECLWLNPQSARASSKVSMEYSDTGDCWRERDRIKKKIRSWAGKYRELPTRERRAILLALLDEENCGRARRKRRVAIASR